LVIYPELEVFTNGFNQELELGVEVEDISASNGRQIAYSNLNIMIEDVNDNSPKFKQKSYKGAVTENAAHGENILKVVAKDADANRSIYYKAEGMEDVIKLIKIDKTSGEIMVGGKIDREQLGWLNFTVRATDSGVPALWSYADVSIQVLDENDHSPVFRDFDSNISVSEDAPAGQTIIKITATDEDEGEFGRVTYFLDNHSGSSKFQINPETGKVT
jgi:hypothetical protein